jgi:hypothetical protein
MTEKSWIRISSCGFSHQNGVFLRRFLLASRPCNRIDDSLCASITLYAGECGGKKISRVAVTCPHSILYVLRRRIALRTTQMKKLHGKKKYSEKRTTLIKEFTEGTETLIKELYGKKKYKKRTTQ